MTGFCHVNFRSIDITVSYVKTPPPKNQYKY